VAEATSRNFERLFRLPMPASQVRDAAHA
jgi:hypothetical protein